MKQVISISLGSSKRDHVVEQTFGGQNVRIERIGTDGDVEKAISLIKAFDGKVDAFGLGGTDLYIYAGGKRYVFRESAKIAGAAKNTPLVDGSGIKNTLERTLVSYLKENYKINFAGRKVLLVCAVDRFGLTESLFEEGCLVTCGDLMYGLGLPLPIRNLKRLAFMASLVAPIITKLPIRYFYPVGEYQDKSSAKFSDYFFEADIIAGDFHFIKKYMPSSLNGKTIITNTITSEDEEMLRMRGIEALITTTPVMGAALFGTNVIEAILVALIGKPLDLIRTDDYTKMMNLIGLKPRVNGLERRT